MHLHDEVGAGLDRPLERFHVRHLSGRPAKEMSIRKAGPRNVHAREADFFILRIEPMSDECAPARLTYAKTRAALTFPIEPRMRLTDLLTPDRVGIAHNGSGDDSFDKAQALSRLAAMLASGADVARSEVLRVLLERETLQSTGIGEGVAIPHGALAQLENQCAALLIVPEGIDFNAIDDAKVNILFAVIGPKRATGEHLKTLARVSRLLRNRSFRDQLVGAPSPGAAFDLIAAEEVDKK